MKIDADHSQECVEDSENYTKLQKDFEVKFPGRCLICGGTGEQTPFRFSEGRPSCLFLAKCPGCGGNIWNDDDVLDTCPSCGYVVYSTRPPEPPVCQCFPPPGEGSGTPEDPFRVRLRIRVRGQSQTS